MGSHGIQMIPAGIMKNPEIRNQFKRPIFCLRRTPKDRRERRASRLQAESRKHFTAEEYNLAAPHNHSPRIYRRFKDTAQPHIIARACD